MPFKSKAQQGYLFKFLPEVAKEFAAATTNYKNLPEHVADKRSPGKSKPKTAKAKAPKKR